MATVKEMMMQDAAAGAGTAYSMSAGDTFEGTITNMAGDSEDWISIEMEAGTTYTITVTGTLAASGGGEDQGDMDTILTLLDSKGGMIAMNDDDAPGMKSVSPGSKLTFTPEVSDTYYISVSTYRNNPNLDNSGEYEVSVTGVVVDPDVGSGINGTERVPANDTATPPVVYVSGNDKLVGTAAGENINGLSGDDSLYGLGGDDTLDGGAGNDLLVGGPGADTLKGGDSHPDYGDTVDYSSSPEGVTINLNDGTARGGDADGDTIENDVENVRGSMHDDVLTGARVGAARHNKLWGLGGDDELNGLRGRDELYGGDGDDNLDGGDDDDILEGGYGADTLSGGKGMDTSSYAGSMMGVTVRLHSGQSMGGDAEGDMWNLSDTSQGYTDSDEEEAEVSVYDIENLTGSAHADILAGDLRNNTIKGGDGDDRIFGGPNPADARDDEDGGSGLTNLDMLHGEGGNDMLFGGYGDDHLWGGDGNDTLNGGVGNDTFYGGAGSDMIHADAGDKIINGWVEKLPTVGGSAQTEAAGDPMASDTVSYAKLEEEITRALNDPGGTTATGGATITNVENIIGSQGDDNLTGNNQDNVIEGGEGGDTLAGGDHGTNGDTLSYEGSDDWVRITLNAGAAATTSRGHASGDNATGFENVRGSAFDDDLTGDTGNNKLWGMAGDDTIEGAGGDDTLEGGAGADDLDGGYNNGGTAGAANTEVNTVSYAGSDAGVTINLMTASASGGHATGDTIVTYEELAPLPDDDRNEIDVARFANVTGSMHDDHLTGNHHDNELKGGAGDDTLRGGASQRGDGSTALIIRGDVLYGGPGADVLDGGEDRGEGNDNMVDTGKDGLDNDDDDLIDEADETAMVTASVDWAVYKEAMEGVTVDLSTNRGTGGEAMGDTLVNIELIWGSEHADTFIASDGADIIEGDGGSDTVSYEASEMGVTVNLTEDAQHRTVTAVRDATTDEVTFGPDADPAAATTHLATATTGVPRLNAQNLALTGPDGDNPENEDTNPNVNGAAGDKLGSIENLTGSAMGDSLTGDENPNVLKGMGGNDTLNGEAEEDTLYGGDGDDTLNGGDGDDMLNGGAGDDTLNGGGGADTLTGGSGNDDMSGGADADTFVFSTADAGDSDAILDFAEGDKIDLSAFELTAEQVIAAATLRGSGEDAYVVINLEAHGGGRITLQDVDSLDDLDSAVDDTTTEGVDESADGVIQTLDPDIFIL